MTRALPSRRVVLLGASNLVRGISTVVETATNALGGPVDVLAALGHGRSYGMESSVLGRKLPGIIQCGLWQALIQRPALPTYALITDIGNDILYGARPKIIASWVETCVRRLCGLCERIVLTELPLESVLQLGRKRFVMIRTLVFPSARISYDDALAAAAEVNDRVISLCGQFDVQLETPRRCWYGIDPIHIKLRHWRTAWTDMLSFWSAHRPFRSARGSLRRWFFLRGLRPQRRHLFGCLQTQKQPAGRLPDGTLVSFY